MGTPQFHDQENWSDGSTCTKQHNSFRWNINELQNRAVFTCGNISKGEELGNPERGSAPARFISVLVLVPWPDAWFEGTRATGTAISVAAGMPWGEGNTKISQQVSIQVSYINGLFQQIISHTEYKYSTARSGLL